MTRAFYETLQLVLHEEDKKYLESLVKEGSKMSEQLEKRQAEMIKKKMSLRAMYDELMDMCLKPDVEMLKVGTEHVPGNTLYYQKPTPLSSPLPLVPMIYFFTSCIYGGECLPAGNNTDELLLLT